MLRFYAVHPTRDGHSEGYGEQNSPDFRVLNQSCGKRAAQVCTGRGCVLSLRNLRDPDLARSAREPDREPDCKVWGRISMFGVEFRVLGRISIFGVGFRSPGSNFGLWVRVSRCGVGFIGLEEILMFGVRFRGLGSDFEGLDRIAVKELLV